MFCTDTETFLALFRSSPSDGLNFIFTPIISALTDRPKCGFFFFKCSWLVVCHKINNSIKQAFQSWTYFLMYLNALQEIIAHDVIRSGELLSVCLYSMIVDRHKNHDRAKPTNGGRCQPHFRRNLGFNVSSKGTQTREQTTVQLLKDPDHWATFLQKKKYFTLVYYTWWCHKRDKKSLFLQSSLSDGSLLPW